MNNSLITLVTAFSFPGIGFELKIIVSPGLIDTFRCISAAILDNAADAIDEIRIQGHTAQAVANRRNPAEGDRFLASNRATIVTLFLQEHSSIHPARIISEGYGQWRPISSNATAESRAPNRRVEMIITGRKLDAEALNDALSQYITQSDEDMNVQDQ